MKSVTFISLLLNWNLVGALSPFPQRKQKFFIATADAFAFDGTSVSSSYSSSSSRLNSHQDDSCIHDSSSDNENNYYDKKECDSGSDMKEGNSFEFAFNRREALARTAITMITSTTAPIVANAKGSSNEDGAAKRAMAYLVDSTFPPTLIPYQKQREAALLKQIGAGYGTSKAPLTNEELNLNNIMNKGLKSTLGLFGQEMGEPRRQPGTSFVFLGENDLSSKEDSTLTVQVLSDLFKPRRDMASAVGLAFAPLSTQPALDSFLRGDSNGDLGTVCKALVDAGVDASIVDAQVSVLQFARRSGLELIALAPEAKDIQIVREEGLQNLSQERRSVYVMDPEGFIATTQDPKFKLYTEKSLLKNFVALDEKDTTANYFAEQILIDEAIASAAARWAILRPKSLVAIVSPAKNVRFMGGANGRIERVCHFLSPDTFIDEDSITTILLNPTAEGTLSQSKFLRLEIGTAPTNIAYQTKLADYLWFSKMPKVNMLPRMMNGY